MRLRYALLWMAVFVYVLARLSQLYADTLPSLTIVLLHVVPPAVFAIVHGSIVYRVKGMLVFSACCLGIGGLSETLSLRTGFPFGHYYFTDVMGPKPLDLPILLVLAYLGIGYVAWVLSNLILGYLHQPITGVRLLTVPLLASFLMAAWDLSMDPAWSTFDHAWIWLDGGPYFGVPITNFLGWYLTAYLSYQAFAFYLQANPAKHETLPPRFWRSAILLYAVCAAGNLLLLKLPSSRRSVTDPTGKQWFTADIFGTAALLSILVMLPLAWLRLEEIE